MAPDRRGRVERALDKDLADRPDIAHAARAGLRAQAHAVDMAEAAVDPEALTEAGRGYLEHLKANGLVAGLPVSDSFAELMAELGRPSTPVGHPEKP